jgi:hypothetical protein
MQVKILKAHAESIKNLDWMRKTPRKKLAKVDKFMIKRLSRQMEIIQL